MRCKTIFHDECHCKMQIQRHTTITNFMFCFGGNDFNCVGLPFTGWFIQRFIRISIFFITMRWWFWIRFFGFIWIHFELLLWRLLFGSVPGWFLLLCLRLLLLFILPWLRRCRPTRRQRRFSLRPSSVQDDPNYSSSSSITNYLEIPDIPFERQTLCLPLYIITIKS